MWAVVHLDKLKESSYEVLLFIKERVAGGDHSVVVPASLQ